MKTNCHILGKGHGFGLVNGKCIDCGAIRMIKFDLEKALAGHPVCTRDGREVTEIHYSSKSYQYIRMKTHRHIEIEE